MTSTTSTDEDAQPPETDIETLRELADDNQLPATVTVGDIEIDAAEFVDRFNAVAEAMDSLDALASNVAALRRTGLRDNDVVDLLYGRNHGLTKTTIAAVLDGLDEIERDLERDREELLVTLVADTSDVGKRDVRETFEELASLRAQYGDDE